MILPMVEVAFVDFGQQSASIVVETTKWLRVVPDVDGAHITHKLYQSMTMCFEMFKVPHHVLHGDLRHPAEQQSQSFPSGRLLLKKEWSGNVPLLPAKLTLIGTHRRHLAARRECSRSRNEYAGECCAAVVGEPATQPEA